MAQAVVVVVVVVVVVARVRADLDEQRLQIVGKPIACRVGVDHREEYVGGGDDGALGDGLDEDRQVPLVLLEDVLPPFLVEVAWGHVIAYHLLGLVNLVLRHDGAAEVALDKVLQAEEADVRPLFLGAAALKVLPEGRQARGRRASAAQRVRLQLFPASATNEQSVALRRSGCSGGWQRTE